MITAYHIKKLLETRHSKDVYVSECKNGSTWFQNHLRLDGLAIARSWANPVVTGYEIKVSRSDFMADEKYYMYLTYCNMFYFVCPTGLIQPEELPENIGLLWTSKTGTRLYKKKKAAYRDVDISSDLYKYILISRAEIKNPGYYNDNKYTVEFWEKWLEKKEYNQEFGRTVRGSIKRVIQDKIDKIERENRKLQDENKEYSVIKEMLNEAGINITSTWGLKYDLEAKLKILKSELPSNMEKDIDNCIADLTKFKNHFKETL